MKFPAVLGVPVIVPALSLRRTPAGSCPEASEKLYGAVPPLTFSVALYAAPTTPDGRVAAILRLGAGLEPEPLG